jgi:hypothetical protein
VADLLVDTEVGQMLLGQFEAELRSIWAEMARELAGYVLAHLDPADRLPADVKVITDRALGLADAASVRFKAALETACAESERQIFEQAPPQ